MKTCRIEIKLTAIIHVGEDVHEEGPPPNRDPDAIEVIGVTRVAHLGERVQARDAVAGHFTNVLANTIPTTAERIRHALREKGF